jgi:hypothetical protein
VDGEPSVSSRSGVSEAEADSDLGPHGPFLQMLASRGRRQPLKIVCFDVRDHAAKRACWILSDPSLRIGEGQRGGGGDR